MLEITLNTEDIVIRKINHDEWKAFDLSLRTSTEDVFTINLSDRLGDVFIDVDWERMEEIIHNEPLLNGVFIQDQIVGLIDYQEEVVGEFVQDKGVTIISFILIHPNFQKQGIGLSLVSKVIEECKKPYVIMYPMTNGSRAICEKLGFEYNRDACPNYDYLAYEKKE